MTDPRFSCLVPELDTALGNVVGKQNGPTDHREISTLLVMGAGGVADVNGTGLTTSATVQVDTLINQASTTVSVAHLEKGNEPFSSVTTRMSGLGEQPTHKGPEGSNMTEAGKRAQQLNKAVRDAAHKCGL